MKYISLFSGIEAATVAWSPMGWTPVAFSEIDKFPCAVLAHHYPDVPNVGDITKFDWSKYHGTAGIVIGGSPCQSFSIAGQRKGMDDERGQLMLAYIAAVEQIRPKWVVWENVPGVLSDDGGRSFGTLLGSLAKLGYGFAYRILDAQYFGLAQRRKRVFVVGYFGDWRAAAAVLFEPESLRGDSPPSRKAGKEVAGTVSARTEGGGGLGTDFECDGGVIAPPLRQSPYCDNASHESGLVPAVAYGRNNQSGSIDTAGALRAKGGSGHMDFETETFVAHAVAFDCKASASHMPNPSADVAPTMRSMNSNKNHDNGGGQLAVAFNLRGRDSGSMPEVADKASLRAASGGSSRSYVAQQHMAVRRLTPVECARLQGFPDYYLNILYRGKPAADGPKYKALGNSMAVPVIRWIGERIAMVDKIISDKN